MSQHRDYAYRGHRIVIDADEDKPGCWGWSFLIDGRIASQARDHSFQQPWAALMQGLGAARARVDSMVAAA
jgi:hypothetical protein